MGWDERRRVELGEDWPGFWIELWDDPPMGAWIDLQEAAAAALRNPGDIPSIERAIAAFTPLVAGHNLTDRTGAPITELSLRALSQGLFLALLRAIQQAMNGANPGPLSKRAPSRAPSSRAGRNSRRASSSGASPAR